MRLKRRKLIEGGIALLALLGLPPPARSGGGLDAALGATNAADALALLFGSEQPTPSGDIELAAPLVAEDGSIVPISVRTALPDVRSISLVVDNNPRPLTVHFELAPGTLPEIGCRIKMAETSDLHALVKTDSGLYSASARVKITRGGCA